jgi:septum formation protein
VKVILASASPRRAELLRAAGIDFDVMPANADETLHPHESPEAYVTRVADAKARAVLPLAAGRAILAADTVVVVDGTILGKPVDRADAARMLRMVSGRSHDVITGVIVICGATTTRLARTSVEFAALSDEDIEWYVATGEPADKAGAYAIQGYASRFITRIAGSYSNVVGLPVAVVCEMLSPFGGWRV